MSLLYLDLTSFCSNEEDFSIVLSTDHHSNEQHVDLNYPTRSYTHNVDPYDYKLARSARTLKMEFGKMETGLQKRRCAHRTTQFFVGASQSMLHPHVREKRSACSPHISTCCFVGLCRCNHREGYNQWLCAWLGQDRHGAVLRFQGLLRPRQTAPNQLWVSTTSAK